MSGSGTSKLGWYVRRLGRMSPAEIAWRVREQAVRRAWARGRCARTAGRAASADGGAAAGAPVHVAVLPAGTAVAGARRGQGRDHRRRGPAARGRVGDARRRPDRHEGPDWFHDPVTGRRSAPEAYAFSLDQRDEAAVGNIKQVWEVNRLQHLTLLAVAWYLTGDDAYAERVAEQLRSWWRENPFLSGINWTSGIELGVRLINFAWIRRLLDGWPASRTCLSATTWRCGRCAGTRSTWRRSRAGARRPTTT